MLWWIIALLVAIIVRLIIIFFEIVAIDSGVSSDFVTLESEILNSHEKISEKLEEIEEIVSEEGNNTTDSDDY